MSQTFVDDPGTDTGSAENPVGGEERQHIPSGFKTPTLRSERVKLRRALTFLGMTLILPGSAQVAAGNKRVGRFALRTWAVLWGLLLFSGLLALVWRSGAVALFTYPLTLRVIQIGLVVLGIGWGILLLDAWRIARPPELARRHRPLFALISLALVAAVVGALVASAGVVSAQRDLVSTVFAGGGEKQATAGRYNILLMGGDAGADRTGLRPDSMTVASVDAETGRTVLISLPRNLEDVPFPESSPLHKRFPNGYSCPDHSCMLNAVYTYAMGHKDLYPGVRNPGAQATKEAIEGATGLKINYWALVDLKGFQALVDAVGGITLDVNRDIPIGGGHAKLYGWVKKGQNRHLNGYEALWFARSRSDSSDYDRMARQKCVMSAMLQQLDPVTVLTNFNQIAAAGKEIVATDIPTSRVDTMLDLAMKAKAKPISTLAFVPPTVYPGAPNFDKVHTMVAKKIAESEAADNPAPAASTSAAAPTASGAPSSSAKASSSATKKKTTASNASDVGAVCAASGQ
ncbi:LCP family protein [Microlunatus ginsengisoli]|uniref:Cell envelope-related transcriptional attenuator domain-containing protein n=1 Tax=Microlunatus ginsengisoli TaxID=363863 RepID=A0ABP6ZGJ7_9ACTN